MDEAVLLGSVRTLDFFIFILFLPGIIVKTPLASPSLQHWTPLLQPWINNKMIKNGIFSIGIPFYNKYVNFTYFSNLSTKFIHFYTSCLRRFVRYPRLPN
ncbi:Protein of unknown function [Pyronema omphalodes CBS 100304]|uniref:Uncharacterized protein n=1 Tax=Pyronema omphalodes (strain CBS 100304) TaxID=1076935 RepID=U4LLB8_PYROM|nr:Protein of unknown function [Pyronema omphalodes CBS 100304]